MGEKKENIQEVEKSQKREISVKKEDIIYALLCGIVVGIILMGSATIVNGWWAYFFNAISSGGYLVVATCLTLLTFYQKFCEKNIERDKLPAKIIATIIYFAIAGFFIFVSWEGLLGKDFSGLTFWLVAISWALVSLLIIVKQISINKQDFDNSPLQSYAYILCGMIYVFAYAVILKFNFDTALKIFYTIHTIVALTVFINIIFRYGIKASNFIQLALFIVSVITLMALLVSTLYFWFWDYSKPELFTAIMGIFAGLIGGVLTLTGVAWTIKRQDDAKKEDETNKAKPYLRKMFSNYNLSASWKIKAENFEWLNVYDFKLNNEEYESVKDKNLIVILNFAIQQSSDNICIITGIKINDVIYKLKSKQVLTKNESLFFVLGKTIEVADFNSLQIIASDIYDNYYAYELEFEENGQERFLKDNNQKGNYITPDSAYFPDDFSYKKYLITDIGMPQKIDYRKEEENHGQD